MAHSAPEVSVGYPFLIPGTLPSNCLNTLSRTVSQSLQEAMSLGGAIGAALVDWQSGMTLGTAGGPSLNPDVAAAGSTEVVRSKLKVMQDLGLDDKIEDILIMLTSQYHLIRLLERDQGLFPVRRPGQGAGEPGDGAYKLTQIERQLIV